MKLKRAKEGKNPSNSRLRTTGSPLIFEHIIFMCTQIYSDVHVTKFVKVGTGPIYYARITVENFRQDVDNS